MNKEDYVSLEVAKLLKEKGYNISCRTSRKKNGELIMYEIEQSLDNMLSIGDECYEYLCPTLYEAQKWIRINHRIHICVDCCVFGWTCILYDVVSGEQLSEVYGCKDTYEEALNAGILEALKIL